MEQKKLTKSDLFSMFVRSNLQQASHSTLNAFMGWAFATT